MGEGRGLISVQVDSAEAERWFREAVRKIDNPRPLLLEIGEDLAASTKERFGTSTAPDGSAWAPNSAVTLARWMDRPGLTKKDGRLNAAGARRLAGKKPLIGASKMLSHTIAYQLEGRAAVLVGSPMIYAATQQFGAGQGEFGQTKRGAPIPWGDIPARPFLGISDSDATNIIDLARRYLARM